MTQEELIAEIRARHFAAEIRKKVEQFSKTALTTDETINLAIEVAFKEGFDLGQKER